MTEVLKSVIAAIGTAGQYMWVNRVDPAVSVTCPLYSKLLSN